MDIEPSIFLSPGDPLPDPSAYAPGQSLYRYDPPRDAELYLRDVDDAGTPTWIARRVNRDPARLAPPPDPGGSP